MVYVLSKNGKPLMPTIRCGHVRILLKQHKARVAQMKPFTIQLLYETDDITQSLYLGIDPGRTNIGAAVVTESGKSVFTAEVKTRNKEIPKLMQARKTFRMAHRTLKRRAKRQRRAKVSGTTVKSGEIDRVLPGCSEPIHCYEIRNKEARFNNRKRAEGWLTPTANHLLLTHKNLILKLQKFLPITDVVLELNRFAFMAMDNPGIKRWQYQKGPLYKKGSVKDAVYATQNGTCLFCDSAIEHYHHVVPKSKGGSETLENRVGLCKKHHKLVHTDKIWAEKLSKTKSGLNKKYHALSVLNQIIPYLANVLVDMFPKHAFVTDGYGTSEFRNAYKIPKDHYFDAYCIACSALVKSSDISVPNEKPTIIKQFRRHDRQACHQDNINRVYMLNGKSAAVNRNKSMGQNNDSLAEFRKSHCDADVSNLFVKPHHATYKNMERVMPGATMICDNKLFTMQRSHGKRNGNPNYYIDVKNQRHIAHKCIIIRNNRGLTAIE